MKNMSPSAGESVLGGASRQQGGSTASTWVWFFAKVQNFPVSRPPMRRSKVPPVSCLQCAEVKVGPKQPVEASSCWCHDLCPSFLERQNETFSKLWSIDLERKKKFPRQIIPNLCLGHVSHFPSLSSDSGCSSSGPRPG